MLWKLASCSKQKMLLTNFFEQNKIASDVINTVIRTTYRTNHTNLNSIKLFHSQSVERYLKFQQNKIHPMIPLVHNLMNLMNILNYDEFYFVHFILFLSISQYLNGFAHTHTLEDNCSGWAML